PPMPAPFPAQKTRRYVRSSSVLLSRGLAQQEPIRGDGPGASEGFHGVGRLAAPEGVVGVGSPPLVIWGARSTHQRPTTKASGVRVIVPEGVLVLGGWKRTRCSNVSAMPTPWGSFDRPAWKQMMVSVGPAGMMLFRGSVRASVGTRLTLVARTW